MGGSLLIKFQFMKRLRTLLVMLNSAHADDVFGPNEIILFYGNSMMERMSGEENQEIKR